MLAAAAAGMTVPVVRALGGPLRPGPVRPGVVPAPGEAGAVERVRGTVLRLAFMTDTHLRSPDDASYPDDNRSTQRVPAAFASALAAGVDLIVYGGDNVFAVDYGNPVASAEAQFEHWRSLTRALSRGKSSVSVIGNHDIWTGSAAQADARGGKGYALQAFGMPSRYYSHDVAGWRFCMLDTFHADGCHVDEEQMAWLAGEVDGFDGPVCIVHHAPIVTLGQFLEQRAPGIHGGYTAPRGWVVGNAADLVRFVGARDNVRLSLCGHMHQVEDIDYLGCRWVDGGAVSGAWWGGSYLDHFPPNLLIIDLDARGGSAIRDIRYESGS